MENQSPADGIEDVGSEERVKSTWSIATETQDVHHVMMLKPKSRPCNEQCPWLAANHGKTVELFYDHEVPGIALPERFTFSTWKRVDIWENDLRNGAHSYGGLCHVRLKGTELTPRNTWKVVSCQCTGALVMQQRELLRQVKRSESALTQQGVVRVASEMLGRQVYEHEIRNLDLHTLLASAHPSLLDPKIGCDAVAPPLSGLAFDLPDIPFSLDQEIDIKNLEINNLGFNGNSPINIGKVETNETPLGDLEYATSAPDPIGFTSAQVDDPKLQPIQLPKLSLPDLATIINIDKLGSSEIPLEIESSTGGSDVNVPLLDWHPRWREEICIKVWRFKKCAFVEFGINLNISLYYRWNITLLRFTVAIRNAFANGISVALKATGIVLETIQIGLLKALKVSSSVVR